MTLSSSTHSAARRLGLGRLRNRLNDRIHRSAAWIAVPPRRLKDVDATRTLPPNAAALTFDDGPSPQVTPKLLRLLESYSAHATFFMCGLAAQRRPDLVRAVLDGGHSIGGHTWDHSVIMRSGLSESEWLKQIDDTQALLTDIAGEAVRWFRPPRGIIDRPTWQRLRDSGLTTVLWSIDGLDCTLRGPDVIAARVTDKFAPGEIALLHDANANFLFADAYPPTGQIGNQEPTLEATKTILEVARSRELDLVALNGSSDWVMSRRTRLRILSRSQGRGIG